jgi:hypothetical protein
MAIDLPLECDDRCQDGAFERTFDGKEMLTGKYGLGVAALGNGVPGGFERQAVSTTNGPGTSSGPERDRYEYGRYSETRTDRVDEFYNYLRWQRHLTLDPQAHPRDKSCKMRAGHLGPMEGKWARNRI